MGRRAEGFDFTGESGTMTDREGTISTATEEPANPMAKDNFTVYLVPGFHSDVVWLEDQRDYAVSLMGDVDQNLAVCRFDPAYGVFLHEITYLKPYLDTHPEQRDYVRQLIADGRIGTGGTHGQPIEACIGGEGLLRNILYGRLYHERCLGDVPEIAMLWDVFGHVPQLGQILAKTRFTGCIWSKDIRGAHAAFWHQALDGSRFLFRRVMYGFASPSEEAALDYFRGCFEELRGYGFKSDVRLDCIDFKPPTGWMAGRCGALAEGSPRVVVSGTAHEAWFRAAHQRLADGKATVPVTARDFEWHHQGTGVSRANLKTGNRLAENALLDAERWATIAACLGASYPDKALDKAWRQVLFNQHHDGMAGPLCDRAYLDAMLGYREALDLATDALGNALDAIAGAADTRIGPRNAIPLLVFNGLNWPRTEPVAATVRFERPVESFELLGPDGKAAVFEVERVATAADGKVAEAEITFLAADVPPMGHTVYAVVPSKEPLPQRETAGGLTIENEFFRITVDPAQGGGITSLFDKRARRELIQAEAGPGNELVALEENPHRSEPAWELYTTGPKVFSRDHAASVAVEVGPVSRRIVVHGEMTEGRPDTAFRRRHDIVLYPGIQRIDFTTRLDHYRGEHHLYVATFPAKLRGCQPVFATAFGALSKRPSKGKLDFRTSKWRNDSDCGARRCGHWFELGRAAVLKAGSSRLAIGMVNLVVPHDEKVVEQAHKLQDAFIRKGVPVTPQFDDCDMARRATLAHEDACLPTPEHFDVDLKYGMSFRISLDVGGQNRYTAGLLERVDPRRRSAFFKRLKDDRHAFVLTYDDRMPGGWRPLPVLLVSATSARELTRALDAALAGFDRTATLEIDPRADVTRKRHALDDYGLAVLNRGNILASVEADNTLCLFLMHTAAWGNTPWGKDRLPFFLIPEHKCHVFHYALYPHRGDWRKARTYRAGLEYNHPLIAAQAARHKGTLPTTHSYLQLEGDSLVLSALKPVGNPTAAFQASPHDVAADGLLVRFYEAEGKPQKGKLTFFQPLRAARATNLLEEPGDEAKVLDGTSVALAAGGFAIESVAIVPELPDKPPASGRLGPEHEPGPVVHFRHWQHNTGAGPLGYSPVGLCLRGRVSTAAHVRQGGVTINTLELGIVNNYTDRHVKGKATLHVGPGWHTLPTEVPYELEPGGQQLTPVLLAFDDARRDGWVKARLSHGGQVYQDVLRVGKAPYIEATLRRSREALTVELHNPGVDPLEGFVAAVTPLESWPHRCVGACALGEVEPREHPFAVPPGKTATVEFAVRVRDEEALTRPDSIWAVLKVACNGMVDYIPIPGSSIVT